MNNLDCIVTALEEHRVARAWDNNAVAFDLLNQLGLDPTADAKHPKPKIALDETAVAAAEAKAKDDTDKAHDATMDAEDARARLEAAKKAEEPASTTEPLLLPHQDSAFEPAPPPPPVFEPAPPPPPMFVEPTPPPAVPPAPMQETLGEPVTKTP